MQLTRLRPWGALALGLSLCGGLLSSAHVSTAATQKVKKPANPLDAILSKLKLSSDQKTAIKAILDAGNVKIKALNEDTTLTQAEKQAAFKAIVDETYASISATLTADQKTVFDAWVAAQPTSTEDKPKGEKPEKPKGEKPEKPKGEKPKGGDDKSGGDCTDKPKGEKPKGEKPRGGKPPKGGETPTPTATPTPTDGGDNTDSGNTA